MANAKQSQVLIDPKKDEYKDYLDKSGISNQISKMLISLYEEPNKPENSDEFIARNFAKKDDIETIKHLYKINQKLVLSSIKISIVTICFKQNKTISRSLALLAAKYILTIYLYKWTYLIVFVYIIV